MISRRKVMFGAAGLGVFSIHRTTALSAREVDDITLWSIVKLSENLNKGVVTSEAVTSACLNKIDIYNAKLNAFLEIDRHGAIDAARHADELRRTRKNVHPLCGVPLGIKDNIGVKGLRETSASRVYDHYVADRDAEVVSRLKSVGAVILGKTNMSEFAFGQSYFGPARNPWNVNKATGGSSTGSAVAVAARLCFGALGTDTACSVRMPSAWCGVSGLKPTFGLVPTAGIRPDAPSVQHCGPIARDAVDASIILDAIAGYDEEDIHSNFHQKENYLDLSGIDSQKLRIGILGGAYTDHLSHELAGVWNSAVSDINKIANIIGNVHLESFHYYNIDINWLMNAERWGNMESIYENNRDLIMPGTRKNLEKQREILSNPFNGSLHQIAEFAREKDDLERLRRNVDKGFQDFDLVILPTMRRIQPDIVVKSSDDKYVAPQMDGLQACEENNTDFSANGLPAMSVPCGFTKEGLPVGLEIVGPHFSERKILAFAKKYQELTNWHTLYPKISPNMKVNPVKEETEYFQ